MFKTPNKTVSYTQMKRMTKAELINEFKRFNVYDSIKITGTIPELYFTKSTLMDVLNYELNNLK